MKTLKTIATLCLCAATALGAELRNVNGVTVDLAPVIAWEADQRDTDEKGERPLPHWKAVTVLELLAPVGTFQQCRVSIGTGADQTILVKNLPAEIQKHFSEIAKLKTSTGRLSDYAQKETVRVRQLDAVAPTFASGSPEYVRAQMAKRDRANLAAANLQTTEETLLSQVNQLADLQSTPQTEYAMFTGQTYAGKPVWDCGVKQGGP